jgi:hypothetical protein
VFACDAHVAASYRGGVPFVPELWLLLLNCAYGVYVYLDFAMGVTAEITALLGIKCFSLPKRVAN